MLPSRDYLRSHTSNAAIAHVLMTSCSATKTRQEQAIRMQQTPAITPTTATTTTSRNKKTSFHEDENNNEMNDISFESKANDNDHNHNNQHNDHNNDNNSDPAFISTVASTRDITRDHAVLPASESRVSEGCTSDGRMSEDRLSLLELICHRGHHRHHRLSHRPGSSREALVRNMGGSGRDPPGEMYGFPPVGVNTHTRSCQGPHPFSRLTLPLVNTNTTFCQHPHHLLSTSTHPLVSTPIPPQATLCVLSILLGLTPSINTPLIDPLSQRSTLTALCILSQHPL